jgi:fructokinase
MAALEGFGIDIEGVQVDADHPSGCVHVHIKENGHEFDIPANQAYDFIAEETARLIAIKNSHKLIYFGTLAQRGAVSRNALQTILDNFDAPRMVDLNLRTPWFDLATVIATLDAADILKLNLDEFDILARMLELPGKHCHEQAESLMSKFPIEKLLLTGGAHGAWLINADNTRLAIVGHPSLRATDTVGAGDAFAAVIIFGLIQGWPDPLILERADEFAQAICCIRGAVPMKDGFYKPFLKEWEIMRGQPHV